MRRPIGFLAALLILAIAASPPAYAEPAGAENFAGKLLVADPSIKDPHFARTVIYLARHDDEGAFGLVINRPLEKFPLAKLLAHLQVKNIDTAAELELYAGGPVQPDYGFVLHSNDFTAKNATVAVDDAFAVSDVRQVLRALAENRGPAKSLFAIGYAGWGAGQLERELERGDWSVVDADKTLVFDLPVGEKWLAAYNRRALDL